MGASISSSIPFLSAIKIVPSESKSTAIGAARKKQQSTKSKKVEVARRSRRITKCDPPRVVFPTIPSAKTPSRKKVPPTPNTRADVEAKTKSILRKTCRFANAKFKRNSNTSHVVGRIPRR